MSPRDALKRITSPFTQEKTVFRPRPLHGDDAQARLSAIMAEIAAMPSAEKVTEKRLYQPRKVSDALQPFILTDAFSIALGFLAAWAAAVLSNHFIFHRDIPSFVGLEESGRLIQYGAIGLGVLAWFWNSGHYRTRMPFWLETQKVVFALGFAILFDGFLLFASKQDFSRLWLVLSWVLAGVSIVALRYIARQIMRRRGTWQLRTMLVGSGVMADEARAALRSEPGLGYEIVVQVENLPMLLARANNSWKNLCGRFSVDYVVIALEGQELSDAESAMSQLVRERMPFSVSPPLRHMPVFGMTPNYFFNHDVMLMTHSSNLEQPLPRFLKRSMDILGAGVGLILLSPALLVLSLVVKKDGGPVFFGDVRIGLDGRAFHCLKFRSMVQNADEILWRYLEENPEKKAEWAVYHKLRDGDPRITKVGEFMRRWSIDEIPQLINVLRGDMSLVGPRPIMFRERNAYSHSLAHYCRVRPGLTGLWQVSGRSDVTFARRVHMDSWYVRNWSLWHDIAILCKTIPVILNKTGAY